MNQKIIIEPWELKKNWLDFSQSKIWNKIIIQNITWHQPMVYVYGKNHIVPRKIAFLGDKGITYTYSGITHRAERWPDWFRPLLDKIQSENNIRFNGCLLNLYRNGLDKMGWHSDDEPEIDESKPIYSLSLGISRDFFLKHRKLTIKKIINLDDGDLLIMHPSCQQNWLHSIPVRKRVSNLRINLTFRCYKI